MSDLYRLPGHLLWRASARVNRAVDEILPGGTDIHGYAALLALADDEPQSQQSLARRIGVSGTTMTSVAESLKREGIVERVRNPVDRRSYSLTRTSAGRSAVRRWGPHVTRLESQLTSGFTEQESGRLREILTQVAGDQLDERTPTALLASTGFLVLRAHQRAHREFLVALRPLDLEPRHVGSLRALRTAGPATQGDLAALLDVSPATVVQIVDHFESRGLVTRQRDPADRRAYQLHLTDTAGQVMEQVTAVSESVLGLWLGGPRTRDHRDLVRLLTRLLTGPATK